MSLIYVCLCICVLFVYPNIAFQSFQSVWLCLYVLSAGLLIGIMLMQVCTIYSRSSDAAFIIDYSPQARAYQQSITFLLLFISTITVWRMHLDRHNRDHAHISSLTVLASYCCDLDGPSQLQREQNDGMSTYAAYHRGTPLVFKGGGMRVITICQTHIASDQRSTHTYIHTSIPICPSSAT